jgi:hypothetical protein
VFWTITASADFNQEWAAPVDCSPLVLSLVMVLIAQCLQGVRAMCLRANNSELVTGGSDGTLICWDITMGSLGRTLKTIQVTGMGQTLI